MPIASLELTQLAQNPAVFLAAILALGVIAQWLAWRLELPSILLLLAFGIGAGRIFSPDDFIPNELLFPSVSLAVGIILFEGGLSLRLKEFKEAGRSVVNLCTIGVLVTWFLATIAAYFILDFDIRIALILGSILTVTGPTVVIPLLRHIKPRKRVDSVAKWEGIVIDPVGAVLAVLVLQAVLAANAAEAIHEAVTGLLITIGVGLGLAFAFGKLLEFALRRHLIPDFLHGTVFLGVAAVSFTLSNVIQHESGLVTVTALGVFLANRKQLSVKHVIEFKENLRVLLISGLFIVLAARIDIADFQTLGLPAVLFVGVLIVLIRPIAVAASTIGTRLNRKERTFLAGLAPRGIVAAAVTSLFAIDLVRATEQGILPESLAPQAESLVPLIFTVIIGTVTFYGFAAGIIARKTGLAVHNPQGILIAGVNDWVVQAGKALIEEGCQVLVIDTNYEKLAPARMAGISTQRASIVSEYIVEEMDLAGIGRLIAATPNDEVNSLAVQEFRHHYGSGNVFQLTPQDSASPERVSASSHLRGRNPFSGAPSVSQLNALCAKGAVIKKSAITDTFQISDFRARYGEDAIILFAVDDKGNISIHTDDAKLPDEGKLISLVIEE
ncbi:cation:proton antiporter [Sulfuriroseicoccus oceanibius]|uniref:Sodium:proton antiporter n=1 Tax=Sulfuriroseicoccus oceanibius TaxID=2707525 RepID=A0A6B3L3V9_9BACT|nr:sodium:proton antiporter [Sulfuriroseicoccus oceanibius]QQL45802.1 sodium:proton antiporter [Sulfuriroseicoccus oceanibius]